MVKRASCHEHRSPAKTGKIMFDLIVDHGRGFGDNLQEKLAQLGNVPLTVAQLIEAASELLVTPDLKRFTNGSAPAPSHTNLYQLDPAITNVTKAHNSLH